MRYKVDDYAQALAEVSQSKVSAEKEKRLAKHFVALLTKNSDLSHANKILARTEALIRRERGDRKLVLETARPIGSNEKALLREMGRFADFVEEHVRPQLVAGMRIIVNEEDEFDASLKRKLDLLFR